MTPNQVARILRVSRPTIMKRIELGELKATRDDNPSLKRHCWTITEEDLQEYLDKLNPKLPVKGQK